MTAHQIKNWSYRGRTAIGRFLARVKQGKESECWEWMGFRDPFGYGVIRVKDELFRAHRFAWLIVNGDIPEGLYVLHKCDVPYCVNVHHLWLGTYRDNVRDCVKKGRHRCLHGSDVAVSKLTEGQVVEIRKIYADGFTNKAAIARQFGVTDVMIGNIIRRRWWNHV